MGACFHTANAQCDNCCRPERDYWGRVRMVPLPIDNPCHHSNSPNRIYETMTRVNAGVYVVRVWRSVAKVTSGPDREVAAAIRQASPTFAGITAAIDALDDVAACEILDANGNGALVYPDWS